MGNRIWKLNGGGMAQFWKVKRGKLEYLSLLWFPCAIKKNQKKEEKKEHGFLEIFPMQTKWIKNLR